MCRFSTSEPPSAVDWCAQVILFDIKQADLIEDIKQHVAVKRKFMTVSIKCHYNTRQLSSMLPQKKNLAMGAKLAINFICACEKAEICHIDKVNSI